MAVWILEYRTPEPQTAQDSKDGSILNLGCTDCTDHLFLKVYIFLGVKYSRPTRSLVWVRERPEGIDPHMLAALLGAKCTSHETHSRC